MDYPTVSIDKAGEELNRLHQSIEGKLKSTVEDAIRAGEILSKVKAKIGHGDFLPWLKANCSFGSTTADRYRKLYEYSSKIPTVGNLQEAYQQIETIERQEKQTEEQKAQQRVKEYLTTGVKPEGWRRGTDDKLAKEEQDRHARIESQKERMRQEEERRKAEKQKREEYKEQEKVENDFLNQAAQAVMEKAQKRNTFKERIRVSDSGEDGFVDAFMDYLESLQDDNRRIEACYNVIKVAKGIAVDLQAQLHKEGKDE